MHTDHGGNVWEASRNTGVPPEKITDFSVNLNPLGPPAGIARLAEKIMGLVEIYPEPHSRGLRSDLSRWLDIPEENLIVGNGASELFTLFFWAMRPGLTVVPEPVYSDYARAARSAGSRVNAVSLATKGFNLPPADFAQAALAHKPEVLVFCNPNNPTGIFWEDIGKAVMCASDGGISLLLDASFLPFATAGWREWIRQSCLPPCFSRRRVESPVMFTVVSLTKIFALPGLRLGIGIGPAGLVEKMEALNDPWSVNTIAQVAGLECINDPDYLEKSFKLVLQERKYLLRGLSRIPGLDPLPSQANFILTDCRRTGLTAGSIASLMKAKGCLVRDAGSFQGLDSYYLRLAVRKRRENRFLLTLLDKVIQSVL